MDEAAGHPGSELDCLLDASHQLARMSTFRSGQFQHRSTQREELLGEIVIE
jgi:hypothetical protein